MAIVLDTIKVPLQKTDEFALFSQAVRDLNAQRPNDIGTIVQQLTTEQKELLKRLLRTKRIVVGAGLANPRVAQPNQQIGGPNGAGPGDVSEVPRQIVTIRRRPK